MKQLWPYYTRRNTYFFKDGVKRLRIILNGNEVKWKGDPINKVLNMTTKETVHLDRIKFKNI